MKLLAPDIRKERITEISADMLREIGVKGVIVDLDNTLGGYDDPLPPDDVVVWAKEIISAGLPIFLVSNNSHIKRVSAYANALGIPFKRLALKPLPFKLRRAVREMGFERREVCAIGDQRRTDVLGARLAGVKVALVTPVAALKRAGVL